MQTVVQPVAAHRFRSLVVQSLLLPLLSMIAFAAILLWQVERVLNNQWWVDHTDQVIADASELHAVHLRAESAVRGYLITHDDSFRAQFEKEVAEMTPRSDALARLVSDNPGQVQSLEKLALLRQQWLELIYQEISMFSSSGDWLGIVKSGVTRSKMQSMNAGFQAFVGVEQGLRDRRTEAVRRSFKIAIYSAIICACLLGASLALLARRQLRYLTGTYDQALREANEATEVLEKRVAERTAALIKANAQMAMAGEALRISNDRLKVSNRELQDFASVASHDLQEPLRKVQAFGDRLKVKVGPHLGPEGEDYLDRMLNAAARMKTLINDLLTFARVTSRAQPFQKVDLKLVADQVISDLEARIEQSHAIVQVRNLPVIDADVTQMRQLMQNLIGNALKFAKSGQNPLVEVDAAEVHSADGERYQIRVRDHGIGFDEKYLDRIFTVFQRLHGRSEYEGTGIGLAVCRKIVERHRGTITAQSRPGEGAVFIVDLPSTQQDLTGGLPAAASELLGQEIVEAASA